MKSARTKSNYSYNTVTSSVHAQLDVAKHSVDEEPVESKSRRINVLKPTLRNSAGKNRQQNNWSCKSFGKSEKKKRGQSAEASPSKMTLRRASSQVSPSLATAYMRDLGDEEGRIMDKGPIEGPGPRLNGQYGAMLSKLSKDICICSKKGLCKTALLSPLESRSSSLHEFIPPL